MNKVIYVGFNTEAKAYEGARALYDMHKDGTLTLYTYKGGKREQMMVVK